MDDFTQRIPSTNIFITISPFFQLSYRLHTLQIEEEVGGKLPTGTVDFELLDTKSESSINSAGVYKVPIIFITIIDKDDEDIYYNITGWITKRETVGNNHLILEFICYPFVQEDPKNGMDFFTRVRTTIFTQNSPDDIKKHIKKLWKGNWVLKQYKINQGKWSYVDVMDIDLRCDTDLGEVPKIMWQRNESDYSFLTKLLYCWRSNYIFGYSWDGLMMKELKRKNWRYLDEPGTMLVSDADGSQSTPVSRNFEYKLHQQFIDPFEKLPEEKKSKNIVNRLCDGEYYFQTPDWNNMLDNFRNNWKDLHTRLYSSFEFVTTQKLPRFKLGDFIIYINKDETIRLKEQYFINTANKLFIAAPDVGDTDQAGNKFSITSVFRGVEDMIDVNYFDDQEDRVIKEGKIFGI